MMVTFIETTSPFIPTTTVILDTDSDYHIIRRSALFLGFQRKLFPKY